MEVVTYDIDEDGDAINSESEYSQEEEENQQPKVREDPIPDSLKRIFAKK